MLMVAKWTCLTNHARLPCIAHDPGCACATLRPAWASPSAPPTASVTGLAEAGHIVKHKDGRRNRCQIQAHLPLPEPARRERAVRCAALRHLEQAASIKPGTRHPAQPLGPHHRHLRGGARRGGRAPGAGVA
jgi:hypothetical protein